jgi:hypothetical protein
MRSLILVVLFLFMAAFSGSGAEASVAARFSVAAPRTEALKTGHCGCKHCGHCATARYTVYRACRGCAPSPYRWGYGMTGYGCGCRTGYCTCGYCSHGCGKEGWYGYPACGDACRLYDYTTTRCGTCAPYRRYRSGWSLY